MRWVTLVMQGSLYGDSQLIRLHPEAVDPAQPNNFVEVMDVWTNLGPIIDLAVVDLERQGQGQVVTCSGKGLDSSLRIVRNGIGMIEQAAVELAGQCFLCFGQQGCARSACCCARCACNCGRSACSCRLSACSCGPATLTAFYSLLQSCLYQLSLLKAYCSAVAGSSGECNSTHMLHTYKAADPHPASACG